ncbi:tRNA (adenosine(37)-N6)-threonylcarbamoyltransferase complex dimerization subunit type 1 TsaB [Marinicella sp. W31]|uniref:tRNA (adenosine(37)-N6)-threonylcarbamoyltransferase complex dimerization subunit type 1 TsaB n=1 Tax=Marinicella sp. W31 TaxID=3023713 RepID=UPI003756E3FD
MNLLAIETATENCSVALAAHDTIYQQSEVAPQRHAQLVLGFVEQVLQQAQLSRQDIEGIVFGQGPGAFTGVRIAVSVVQGLALALDVPVLGISTLKALGYSVCQQQQPAEQSRILVANDARMGEAYHCAFRWENGGLTELTAEQVSNPDNIETSDYDLYVGSAFKTFDALKHVESVAYADALPTAQALLGLALPIFLQQAVPIEQAQPSYVRNQVVQS